MNKHTKGPWVLKHIAGSNFAVQRFEIRGMLGDKSGILPIFNKDTSAIDGASICCSPQDARLITAAPELLGALELFVKLRDDGMSNDYYMMRDAVDAAREIIARAKGEAK